MNLLTMESITKSYTGRELFHEAAFHIQDREKIGIIGLNGMGKSTLLKLIAGIEEADSGTIVMGNQITISYLAQTPVFAEGLNVLQATLMGFNADDPVLMSEAKSMLNRLQLTDFTALVAQLSGGQQKRIALIHTILQKADILVLDEPTNHLDHEMSGWLEGYLSGCRSAVVMVTHDRYFLDRIVTKIVEVDKGQLYSYPGAYSDYVALKMQRQNMELASSRKRNSILKKELAWLARGARARATKQKAHIKRIEDMLSQAGYQEQQQVEMSSLSSRMGKKTIEINEISKAYGANNLICDFSYIYLRNDRIGIVGPNGSGKSTLLKIIIGEVLPDYGNIVIGDTIKIGYFAQDNVHMDEEMKAIDYIREVGEYIQTEEGKITASTLMERFLFDGAMQWSPIGKLSGGERRRLYLLRILMGAPNVLIFDEPTNDLDIQTLGILEDYLDAFDGIVIAVSHDRYFLDRIVNRIFALEGEGHVQQYEGGYLDYLAARAQRYPDKYAPDGALRQNQAADDGNKKKGGSQKERQKSGSSKIKLTYKEEREFASIEEEIAGLEEKLSALEEEILKNATNSLRLQELMTEKDTVEAEVEQKMERWVYLNEKISIKS